jgi:hypothetical protein
MPALATHVSGGKSNARQPTGSMQTSVAVGVDVDVDVAVPVDAD